MLEQVADRCAEVFLDAGHRQGAVEAGQLILQLGQFFQQQRRDDVRPGGEGLASFDEGRPQGSQKFGEFPRTLTSALFVAEHPEKLVKAHPDQKQADGHQGLPETPEQPLGVAGVDPRDGLWVVALQTGGFDEVAEFLGAAGLFGDRVPGDRGLIRADHQRGVQLFLF